MINIILELKIKLSVKGTKKNTWRSTTVKLFMETAINQMGYASLITVILYFTCEVLEVWNIMANQLLKGQNTHPLFEWVTVTNWTHKLPCSMRREEKPTRRHWMVYCTYNMLNTFQALLCPSSGAWDYMCVIAACGVQCSVAGCWGSGAGQQAVHPGRGMLHESRAASLFLDA
jgi:hypothetical protein